MFHFIIHFFNKNQDKSQGKNEKFCIYSEQYRNSYNKLWIQELNNYNP